MFVGCLVFVGYGLCEELKMDGWGKVKWGMTEDAVKKAEPNVEIGDGKADKDDYYFPLHLKNVKIANVDFTATMFIWEHRRKSLIHPVTWSGRRCISHSEKHNSGWRLFRIT